MGYLPSPAAYSPAQRYPMIKLSKKLASQAGISCSPLSFQQQCYSSMVSLQALGMHGEAYCILAVSG